MALEIKNSLEPYSKQKVNINGNVLTLIFKYVGRGDFDGDWYLDIFNSSETQELQTGIKIMPNQNLTGRYIIDGLPDGNFWCIRIKDTKDRLNYSNFGVNKTYSLHWFSSAEEEEANINGTIQL